MIAPHPFVRAWVLIEDVVLARVAEFRQATQAAREAGGILLGFRRGPHLHVAGLSTPMAADRRARHSFHRHAAGHARFATRSWRRSGGRCDYVGEWHTHPDPAPAPSAMDLREWRLILRRRAEPMVLLICGTDGIWLGVGWRGSIRAVAGLVAE